MADLVVSLSDVNATDPAITGGKGSVLARLVEAKLPVPDGFVVTVSAFQHSLSDVLPEIEQALSGVTHEDVAEIERASEHATGLLGAHSMSSELRDRIEAAYRALGGGPVAVRSSATAEDMPEASFAGQYDTHLNILNVKDVLKRVVDVWASLYSPHAINYRKRQGIDEGALRMAVVVQRLLPANAAGVLFTRDPVSGADDRFSVNAAYGLGEGVVDGTVPIDQFGLHERNGKVLSKDIADKQHKMSLAARGGLKRMAVSASRRKRAALSTRQLNDLAKLARRVKKLFGGHQDIEFAVHGGDVHLLQARPITAIEDEPDFPIVWEKPANEKHFWMLRSIGQREVHPVKRLEQDVMTAYAKRTRVCFEETGSPLARLHTQVFQNGYVYSRQPDVKEQDVNARLQRYYEVFLGYVERRESWWDLFLRPQVTKVLDPLSTFRPKSAQLPELVKHLEAAVDVYAHVLGDLHWRLSTRRGPGEHPMTWAKDFAELTGLEEHDAGVLVQAIDTETTRMIAQMRELARIVQGSKTLSAIFKAGTFARLRDASVRKQAAAKRFQARFRAFLRRYGKRTGWGFGSAANFSSPTWNMKPEDALEQVASYADQDLDEIDELEENAIAEREEAVAKYRKQFAKDPDKLARFDMLVFQACDDVETMENHNYMMEQMTGGALREAISWVGRRLVRDDLIDGADDAMHLTLAELRKVSTGKKVGVRKLVGERQEEFEWRTQLNPPPSIGTGKPSGPPQLPAWAKIPSGVGRTDGGRLIRGVSGSRGRVTGRALVAPQTAKPPVVTKGDILVATNAGPNWTPIFPLIGGLVLDQGAVFQHAALVAREYKIPAVIMTKEGSTTIKDGQTITVDGDQGIVELE